MAKLTAKNPLLGILTMVALMLIVTMTIQPLLINRIVNAQLLNDRDNDGIEDELDPCPDDPDTACTTPDSDAILPGINAPIEQGQEQGSAIGMNETTASETPPEIVFCIPNKDTCNQTDVLINEAGELVCDPKERDCSPYLNAQPAGQGQVANICASENQSAQSAGEGEEQQVTNVCMPGIYPWIRYPTPDNDGLAEAEEKQQEQDEIDNFACEFAEHASEAVGAFYTCAKVGEEFKDALNDPTKVVSPKEVAFCGFGISGQFEKKLSIADPVGWLAGKEGKLVCKGTIAIKNWLLGKSNIVEKFLANDYDRVERETFAWCKAYGVTPDVFGCSSLENDYDDCKQRQLYWDKVAPETLGIGKPIKLRDGTEVTNILGRFEYPCSFPSANPSGDVCGPEEEPESVCRPDTISENTSSSP